MSWMTDNPWKSDVRESGAFLVAAKHGFFKGTYQDWIQHVLYPEQGECDKEAYRLNSEWDRLEVAVADGIATPLLDGAL